MALKIKKKKIGISIVSRSGRIRVCLSLHHPREMVCVPIKFITGHLSTLLKQRGAQVKISTDPYRGLNVLGLK